MNELQKTHQCYKCKEWFHVVHVCADDVKAMPTACTTATACRQHGCHGACLPPKDMTQREEFELWHRATQASPLKQDADGEYGNAFTNARWEAWQAAKQAQPSQAVEPTEAQLVTGVKAMRLFVTKNSIKDFRDGFIAAINAKESK